MLAMLAVLACACGQGGALRGPAPAESATPVPAQSPDEGKGPAQLSREEIVAGMQSAQRRVRACPVDPGTTSATVAVRVKVATNGRIRTRASSAPCATPRPRPAWSGRSS